MDDHGIEAVDDSNRPGDAYKRPRRTAVKLTLVAAAIAVAAAGGYVAGAGLLGGESADDERTIEAGPSDSPAEMPEPSNEQTGAPVPGDSGDSPTNTTTPASLPPGATEAADALKQLESDPSVLVPEGSEESYDQFTSMHVEPQVESWTTSIEGDGEMTMTATPADGRQRDYIAVMRDDDGTWVLLSLRPDATPDMG